jgi:peptide/nickel transport system substrate-binding protein
MVIESDHERELCLFYLLWGAAILLSACTNRNLSPPDTITTIVGSPISSLNPLYATDANSQHVGELMHASLVLINRQLLPEPYLAESAQVINPLTLEFKLRSGCRFHSGRPVTVEDVERSLAYFVDPKNGSSFAETYKRVVRFEKINELTFRLHTEIPAPSLLSDLEIMKILDLEGVKPGERPNHIPGAGPYKLSSFSSSEIDLERVPASCLPLPPSPKIVVKTVRDDLSRYLKLKAGEIDVVSNELNFRKIEALKKDPSIGLRTSESSGIGYSYLGLNFRSAVLQDARVRRALALSFDIPALIRYKSRGMAEVGRNVLADQNYFADLTVPKIERNLVEARRLLDEAGFSNGGNGKPPLRLKLLTTTASFNIENAQVLVAQAREAGIILDHHALEWGVFYSDVKAGNTELYMLRWLGVVDPRIYFEAFNSKEIGRTNRTSYKNPEMDALTDLGERTMDREERRKIYWKVQKLVARDLPYIGLWYGTNITTFRQNIHGLESHPSGSWKPLLKARKE